ncbi:MAG: aminotransferase class IV [Bacteroidales bacterium]|nr:aminotransferase class IV [Bacteroidales bacterium]
MKHKRLMQVAYHNNRVNDSRKALFGLSREWDLSEIIHMPDLDPDLIYRCRLLYAREVNSIEFVPYVRRNIQNLYVVDCGDFDYSFKYAERSVFEKLKAIVPDPEVADILLIKNGLITDTSFSNIILYDGLRWYTPAIPLLKGTKREYYIDKEMIFPRDIRLDDLHLYKKLRLINAMLDWDEGEDIPIEHIIQ